MSPDLLALDTLRKAGWSVAVHNDYRLNGVFHTFWLFTNSEGRFVKGEGKTDAAALAECFASAGLFAQAPVSDAEVEAAISNLRSHQTQLDQDGIMVGVSRQALDIVLRKVSELEGKVKAGNEVLQGLVDGVTPEVNEKGAGGYLLARLTDARTHLSTGATDAQS